MQVTSVQFDGLQRSRLLRSMGWMTDQGGCWGIVQWRSEGRFDHSASHVIRDTRAECACAARTFTDSIAHGGQLAKQQQCAQAQWHSGVRAQQ